MLKKTVYILLLLALGITTYAENPNVRFYWYHVQLEATEGGLIYATGDWRLPMSEDEFGSSVTIKWVVAGTNNRSSCYAWAIPDEGYQFAGWYSQNGTQLLATDTTEARIWATTTVSQTEDGIVSGNDFYELFPSDTVVARFIPVPGPATELPQTISSPTDEQTYDLSGRLIRTSQNGFIYIRGGKKYLRRN